MSLLINKSSYLCCCSCLSEDVSQHIKSHTIGTFVYVRIYLERFHPCGNSYNDSLQQEPLFEYHPYQCGSLEYVEINLSSEH